MSRVFLLVCFFIAVSSAQYDDPTQFFPVAVGNKWYRSTEYGPSVSEVKKINIDSTGKKRIYFSNPDKPTYIMDSNMVYNGYESILLYKLDADSGDGWSVRKFDTDNKFGYNDSAIVEELFEDFLFGVKTKFMRIEYYYVQGEDSLEVLTWLETHILAYGFGLVWYNYENSDQPDILEGCVINGVEYGYVGIDDWQDNFDEDEFEIRNYPNPFNASTKILLPSQYLSNVEWKLFDITGRLILKGINERHSNYMIIDLTATSVPSGNYIIQIISGQHIHRGIISYIK